MSRRVTYPAAETFTTLRFTPFPETVRVPAAGVWKRAAPVPRGLLRETLTRRNVDVGAPDCGAFAPAEAPWVVALWLSGVVVLEPSDAVVMTTFAAASEQELRTALLRLSPE